MLKKLEYALGNSTSTIVVRGKKAEAFASKVQAILLSIEASLVSAVRLSGDTLPFCYGSHDLVPLVAPLTSASAMHPNPSTVCSALIIVPQLSNSLTL